MTSVIVKFEGFCLKMIVPAWISKELFEKALKCFHKTENVEIISFTSKDAVPPGENYTSDLFRTTLTYRLNENDENPTISLIVKCGNEDGGVKQDIAKNLKIFEKEAEMFGRTLPAIYDILGESYTLSSKCYYTTVEPHAIIVLEDLTTIGFNMLPRHIGFDLDACFRVVEKMAKLHAASVIMYEKDPSLVRHYGEGLYHTEDKTVLDWIKAGYSGLIDACSRWPGFEKYGYKLQALGEEALRRGFLSQKRKLGGFHVLNHGDLWVNNMMFSYAIDGKVKDLRFVDFQMVLFTSPAIDLHYFIATSTNIEVKLDHIEIILDHYYAQLLANLAKLQYSLERVPTREQFKRDYNNRAFYGVMAASTVLAFVKASKGRTDASFENIVKDDSLDGFRYHAYNNERYRRHMEHLLPYYDSFGILD
ncbi:hypothetical protein JTB14_037169 [Gonioctena quinquepunctata]|nr:hypothetical protein JTB14_037169 [Gonioctena quinquepunctata]